MLSQFVVTTERRGSTMIVGCRGELDVTTCARLEEAIVLALTNEPRTFVFDGTAITLLTSSGIKTLFELARTCRDRSITLELKLSKHARRILDLVGLWWLGVVDDGLAVEDSLSDALRAYAQFTSDPGSVDEGNFGFASGSDYFLG